MEKMNGINLACEVASAEVVYLKVTNDAGMNGEYFTLDKGVMVWALRADPTRSWHCEIEQNPAFGKIVTIMK